jgi:hypothetical protein
MRAPACHHVQSLCLALAPESLEAPRLLAGPPAVEQQCKQHEQGTAAEAAMVRLQACTSIGAMQCVGWAAEVSQNGRPAACDVCCTGMLMQVYVWLLRRVLLLLCSCMISTQFRRPPQQVSAHCKHMRCAGL